MSHMPVVLIVSERDFGFLEEILNRAGYRAMGVPDQESARAVFEYMQPELVISEYPLAADRGHSFVRFVKMESHRPTTLVLGLLGARELPSDPFSGMFDGFCRRPLTEEGVLGEARRLLPLVEPPTP